MAVGWICASAILARNRLGLGRIDDHGADLRLCRDLPLDLRLAIEAPGAATAADLAAVEEELVSGHDGPAELRLVDSHEVDELRRVALAEAMDAQRTRRLREALDDENARHDGVAREVALEEWLVDGHVLEPDGGLVAIHVEDAIDQEERIAMRQQLEQARDIGCAELLLCCRVIHCPALRLPRSPEKCLVLPSPSFCP